LKCLALSPKPAFAKNANLQWLSSTTTLKTGVMAIGTEGKWQSQNWQHLLKVQAITLLGKRL